MYFRVQHNFTKKIETQNAFSKASTKFETAFQLLETEMEMKPHKWVTGSKGNPFNYLQLKHTKLKIQKKKEIVSSFSFSGPIDDFLDSCKSFLACYEKISRN